MSLLFVVCSVAVCVVLCCVLSWNTLVRHCFPFCSYVVCFQYANNSHVVRISLHSYLFLVLAFLLCFCLCVITNKVFVWCLLFDMLPYFLSRVVLLWDVVFRRCVFFLAYFCFVLCLCWLTFVCRCFPSC